MAPLKQKKYWVSCAGFTIQVNTNERGLIVWTAPIAKKFVGQMLDRLLYWADKRFGLVTLVEL